MNVRFDQQQGQTQKQTFSQRMIQSTQVLELPVQELQDYLEKMAVDNPVILLESGEETDTSPAVRDMEWLNSSDYQNRIYYSDDREDDEETDRPDHLGETLEDYLLPQLTPFFHNKKDCEIYQYLVESLDSRGYLTEGTDGIRSEFDLSLREADMYLDVLKSCDPAGIGAGDLRECLLLQLERYGEGESLAAKIVRDDLEIFAKNRLNDVALSQGVTLKEVNGAAERIKKLNPKPGNGFSDRQNLKYIYPDVIVIHFEDYFEVLVNDACVSRIKADPYYTDLLKDKDLDSGTASYIKSKLDQINWTVQCVDKRNNTLHLVSTAIIKRQKSFFINGPGYLVPMRMQDIADDLGLNVSTISRAAKEKYLQCSFGIFPMNYFFTTAMPSGSDKTVSSDFIKEKMCSVIDSENKKDPMSDKKIAETLTLDGYKISRRTVAKYRAQLSIPDAAGRKEY